MKFIETSINGVILIKPKIFPDDRGYFLEVYDKILFNKNGISNDFGIKDNESFSKYGTIRGLHFQTNDFAQAKLVRVVYGRVLDVAVDLRPNSKTFGKHVAVKLTDKNKRLLFIPRGFAHGFSVLSDFAIFNYKCDNSYNPDSESGIVYNDQSININWKIPKKNFIVSGKDAGLQTLQQYLTEQNKILVK